jgi:hypothetical protein
MLTKGASILMLQINLGYYFLIPAPDNYFVSGID